ncbi:hypothetical protein DFH29DRAFT_777077, partial [Suillus ampliporus]
QMLVAFTPYLGDDLSKKETFSGQQFNICETGDTHHCIIDKVHHAEENVLVPSDLLRNPSFYFSDW